MNRPSSTIGAGETTGVWYRRGRTPVEKPMVLASGVRP